MGVSILLPLAILASVFLGIAVFTLFSIFAFRRDDQMRWTLLGAGTFLAMLLNSWWIFVLGLAYYKLVILGQDT
jgi:hypothetical protein